MLFRATLLLDAADVELTTAGGRDAGGAESAPPRDRETRFHIKQKKLYIELPYNTCKLLKKALQHSTGLNARQRRSAKRTFEERDEKRRARAAAAQAVAANGGMPPGLAPHTSAQATATEEEAVAAQNEATDAEMELPTTVRRSVTTGAGKKQAIEGEGEGEGEGEREGEQQGDARDEGFFRVRKGDKKQPTLAVPEKETVPTKENMKRSLGQCVMIEKIGKNRKLNKEAR